MNLLNLVESMIKVAFYELTWINMICCHLNIKKKFVVLNFFFLSQAMFLSIFRITFRYASQLYHIKLTPTLFNLKFGLKNNFAWKISTMTNRVRFNNIFKKFHTTKHVRWIIIMFF